MKLRLELGILALCPLILSAQKGGSVSRPPASSARTNDNAYYNSMGVTTNTLVVYGNVTLAGGAAPAQLVTVERVCGGSTQSGGFADSKGRFSFDLGILNRAALGGGNSIDNLNSTQLAANRVDPERLKSCMVRASLAGYRSDTLSLAATANGQKTALGTIVLKPFGAEEAPSLSATSSAVPKNAKKDFEKGLDLAARAKWPEAIESLTKAVAGYPEYASAWLSLGLLQAGSGNAAAALESYRHAIAADPRFAPPYIEAALLETQSGDWEKSASDSDKAIALAPDSVPRAYLLNATANLNARRLEAARHSAEAGLKLDRDREFPDLEYVEGIALMGANRDADARKHLETYLSLAPQGTNAASARQTIAKLPAK